jgi:hypothetical protein
VTIDGGADLQVGPQRAGLKAGSSVVAAAVVLCAAALVWTGAAERGAAQGPPPGSPGATSSGVQANLPAISGTVVEAATGKPLAAVVSVRQGSGPAYRQATDDAGRFLFSNLDIMTTYLVTAEKPGYLLGTSGATALGPLQEIRLTSTHWLSNVEIKLVRESAVSGRVLDGKGEPLAGVRVVAQRRMTIAGELRLVNGATVTTDDRGHYRRVRPDGASGLVIRTGRDATRRAVGVHGPSADAIGIDQFGSPSPGLGVS